MAARRGGAEDQRRRGARPHAHHRARRRGSARRQRRAHGAGPRPLVPRPDGRGRPVLPARARWTASTCCSCSTRRARRPSPRASCTRRGGYLTQVAFTHKYVFDLHPDTDVYWCTADIGWVTGHSYIVYGPLANGATSVMYEGTPDYPAQGPALGDRREVRRHDPLHRAHRHPHVHEVGHRRSRRSTTCRRCGCSARWASPSTPRRGCGTTSTSAAAAARSSTRGGRPRPAAS